MPRSLEDACPWTPAAATSSSTTTARQEIWLHMAIVVLRRRCTCYLKSCRPEKYDRVAAQCVSVAALEAAISVYDCASVHVPGPRQQSGANDAEARDEVCVLLS